MGRQKRFDDSLKSYSSRYQRSDHRDNRCTFTAIFFLLEMQSYRDWTRPKLLAREARKRERRQAFSSHFNNSARVTSSSRIGLFGRWVRCCFEMVDSNGSRVQNCVFLTGWFVSCLWRRYRSMVTNWLRNWYTISFTTFELGNWQIQPMTFQIPDGREGRKKRRKGKRERNFLP